MLRKEMGSQSVCNTDILTETGGGGFECGAHLVYLFGRNVQEILESSHYGLIYQLIDLESSPQEIAGAVRSGQIIFILDKKLLDFLRKRKNVKWQKFLQDVASVYSSSACGEVTSGVPQVTAIFYCLSGDDVDNADDLFEGLPQKIVSSEHHLPQVIIDILQGEGGSPLRTSTPCDPSHQVAGPTVGIKPRLTFSHLDQLDEFTRHSPKVIQSDGLQSLSSGHRLTDGTFSSARTPDQRQDNHCSPPHTSRSVRSDPVGGLADDRSTTVSSYLRAGDVGSLDPTRSMSSLGLEPGVPVQQACCSDSDQAGRPTQSQPHALYCKDHPPSHGSSPGVLPGHGIVQLPVRTRSLNPFLNMDGNGEHGQARNRNENGLYHGARSSGTEGMTQARGAMGDNFNRTEPHKDYDKSFDDNNMQMSFGSSIPSLPMLFSSEDSKISTVGDPVGATGGATHFQSVGQLNPTVDKASGEAIIDDTLVVDLSPDIVDYLSQELDVGPMYGKGWPALAALKGYRFSHIRRIEGNSRIDSPFQYLLGQQQFSGYTLGQLKEDLHILPRLDILHHLQCGRY